MNGGLNSTASPLTVAQNEASDLLNIDFDKFGSVVKRSGYLNINTSALNSGAQITGLHWYEPSVGTDYLVVVAGDKIYAGSLNGSFTDITGSLTITPGNLWKFQMYLDNLYATNGVDAPWKWDGDPNNDATLMTLPTNITIPKYIKLFNSYTFLADSYLASVGDRERSRLNWSVVGTGDTWLDQDFAYINRNDGQEITGLEVLGDRLVIFKSRSIWIGFFNGDVDVPFQFQKTQSHVGCVSGYSIQPVMNGLMFMGEDGVYFFDGNQSQKLSHRINETIYAGNAVAMKNTVSMYQRFKQRTWFSQTSGGQNEADSVITFDDYNNAFSRYNGMHPSAMCMAYSSGQEIPIFGDYDGWIYRADTGLDDYPAKTKTAIDAYYYTKWFDYDDLVNSKGLVQLDVYYKYNNATLSVAYSYNFEEADQYTLSINTSGGIYLWNDIVPASNPYVPLLITNGLIWDSGTWAGSGGGHYRLDIASRGRVVRIGFKNNILSETFRIDGVGQLVHQETNQ